MLTDENIELFKTCFIDNQSSIEDLILVKDSLIEFRDKEIENILAEYIDEKLMLISKRK